MCFPFFTAQGHAIGDSLCAEDDLEPAQRALAAAERRAAASSCRVDLVLGDRFDADAEVRALDGVDVPDGWMGLDIGPRTAERYAAGRSRGAGTVFWNGPMGAFELEPFAAGTRGRGRGGGGLAGRRPWSAAATRAAALRAVRARRPRRPTSRPAAAPRSSWSRARRCPEWRRCDDAAPR